MIGNPVRVLSVIVTAVLVLAGAATQSARPILLLISLDGFRWDYLDRADVPNLRALAAAGVRAEALIPAFPSETFPNHYTIVTGLYPEHHGIVSNTIVDRTIGPERFTMSAATARDPHWWGGEPLWVTAIRQGRRASTMFWPGSEVTFGGVRPTDWTPFDDAFSNGDRVKRVLTWLARPERPALSTIYFSEVDRAGHDFGPESPEVLAAAGRLDDVLGALVAGVGQLGLTDRTSYVIVSDHGMSQQAADRIVFLDDHIDLAAIDVVEWSPVLQVLPRSGSAEDVYRALKDKHPALAVYKREELPAHLHYRSHPRIPPIVGLADDGWTITSRQRDRTRSERRRTGGDHGYDPSYRSMHGLFVASGPMFRRGAVVPAFENVHLYDVMCRALGLTPAQNDGDPALASRFLSR